MTITVGRAVFGLLVTSATGVATVFTSIYWHFLMQQLGLLLVLPVAAFIGLQIFLVVKLENAKNETVRAIGKAVGTGLMYLALFEALIFTVLVIWLVSAVFSYDQPATRADYATDFVIGAGYLSAFVYGATGLTAMIGSKVWQKVLGGLFALVTIGVPLTLLIGWEAALNAYGQSNPGALLTVAVLYFLAVSVLGMALMLGGFRGSGPDRKAAEQAERESEQRPTAKKYSRWG